MIDGHRLRRLRLDRGLSQQRLASNVGVDKLTIHRIETGADGSDLPLRVVAHLADTLGVPLGDLLYAGANGDDDLIATIGATLIATGPTTRAALAEATGADADDIDAAIEALRAHLAIAGIGIACGGDAISLTPGVGAVFTGDDAEANLHQARLLRRIHRGEDISRKLTQTNRSLTLPSLLRAGLVELDDGKLRVTDRVRQSLPERSARVRGDAPPSTTSTTAIGGVCGTSFGGLADPPRRTQTASLNARSARTRTE